MQGEVEQQSEQHPNDSSVTNDPDGCSSGFAQDQGQGLLDPLAEIICGFRFGDAAAFKLVQPLKRADLVPFLDLFPTQAGPDTEIDFPQPGEDDGRFWRSFHQRNHGLLNPPHGTGVESVERTSLQVTAQGADLIVAFRGKVHVDSPAENAMVAVFHFRMANQDEFESVSVHHLRQRRLLQNKEFLESGPSQGQHAGELRVIKTCDGRAQTPQGRKMKAHDLRESRLTEAEIERQIREGSRIKTGVSVMPAFGRDLTDAEIQALIVKVKLFRPPPAAADKTP